MKRRSLLAGLAGLPFAAAAVAVTPTMVEAVEHHLSVIPEPSIPLNEAGRRCYENLMRVLLKHNRLTSTTLAEAEGLSCRWQVIHASMCEWRAPAGVVEPFLQPFLQSVERFHKPRGLKREKAAEPLCGARRPNNFTMEIARSGIAPSGGGRRESRR